MKRMMAHPKPSYWMHRLTPRPRAWAPIAVLAILAFALLGPGTNVPSAAGATSSSATAWTEVVHTVSGDCTLHFQQYAPGTKSVEDLLGPSYATIWVNQGAIPANGPYQGMRGQNPSWGTAERKAFVNLYEEVHLFWAGGTFVSATPRTTYCRNLLLKRYNNDARTAISRFTVEQVGLGLYNTDLR